MYYSVHSNISNPAPPVTVASSRLRLRQCGNTLEPIQGCAQGALIRAEESQPAHMRSTPTQCLQVKSAMVTSNTAAEAKFRMRIAIVVFIAASYFLRCCTATVSDSPASKVLGNYPEVYNPIGKRVSDCFQVPHLGHLHVASYIIALLWYLGANIGIGHWNPHSECICNICVPFAVLIQCFDPDRVQWHRAARW